MSSTDTTSLTNTVDSPSTLRKKTCNYCNSDFNLLQRKRRCRMCNNYFCSDCCSVKASYPLSYEFKGPQWACITCVPQIFNLRSSSDSVPDLSVDSPKTKKSKVGAVIDGTFHTSGHGEVHTMFKMADPVCRLVFRVTGMYEGGKLDRSTLKKAMNLNKIVVKLPSVGNVERHFIPVPVHIEEVDWKVNKVFERPPFLKQKRKKKSKKSSVNSSGVNMILDEMVPDSPNTLRNKKEKEWDEISVFVYTPKNVEEGDSLPILVSRWIFFFVK